MIDAKTARTLVAESETLMMKYIEDIGKVIEREARLGKSSVFPSHTTGVQFRSLYDTFTPPYESAEMTGVQKLIKAKLEMLGFSMRFEKQEVKVGGGLGSMDDEVTYEDRDYIKIAW
jgi:hypothetical protein